MQLQITLGSSLWDQVRPHSIKKIGGRFYPTPATPSRTWPPSHTRWGYLGTSLPRPLVFKMSFKNNSALQNMPLSKELFKMQPTSNWKWRHTSLEVPNIMCPSVKHCSYGNWLVNVNRKLTLGSKMTQKKSVRHHRFTQFYKLKFSMPFDSKTNLISADKLMDI